MTIILPAGWCHFDLLSNQIIYTCLSSILPGSLVDMETSLFPQASMAHGHLHGLPAPYLLAAAAAQHHHSLNTSPPPAPPIPRPGLPPPFYPGKKISLHYPSVVYPSQYNFLTS